MTWDPEIDDPITRPRALDPEAGTDEPAQNEAARTEAPDLFAPIDPNAPVSGHRPATGGPSIADAIENDWTQAASRVLPVLRPADAAGIALADVAGGQASADGRSSHRQPILDTGPAQLRVAFALPAEGFDVLVNVDHVLAWGVDADVVASTAMDNLERWSRAAEWTEEEDEHGRRIVSSASGDGWDASRILVPEARAELRRRLDGGRILVGVPDRDLLVAARLVDGDPEFAALFASFVTDQAEAADDAISASLYELVGDDLREFRPT